MQVADPVALKETLESRFSRLFRQDLPVMKTDVSSAGHRPVADDAGIGVFPTCACALGATVSDKSGERSAGLERL